MDPCVTCGTTEETTSVCTCDCQCLETARRSGCREIKLIAPTRDTATAWTENDPIVPEGVFFLVKDRLFEGSLEYAIGDGESKYSELSMLYAGAPLSRTGAENHSPLAASGKSTLDPSWLPDATSSAKGAVMTSTTGAAGKVPIAASGASALDPSWLPVATSSALGGVMTSTTGASGKVPIADSSGKLDSSWLPDATSSTKGAVMASTTTAANNVVKADANGGLDGWKGAIIDAIIADDGSGGLSAGEDGNLEVDFDAMYTHNRDKFEALLKSLKMQIPLETDLNLYVNGTTGTNTTAVEGQGKSAELPFKTIQYAVNYATQNYAVGSHTIYIYVAGGTYQESVTLPIYTRTTGKIVLRALDYTNKPKITNVSTMSTPLSATGGTWSVNGIDVDTEWSDPANGVSNFPSAFAINGNTTSVSMSGCSLSAEYTGSAPSASSHVYMRVLNVSGGAVCTFEPIQGLRNEFSCTKGNADSAVMIHMERSATINIPSRNTADNGSISGSTMYEIPCSGTCTFLEVGGSSLFSYVGGGLYFQQFLNDVTGKKCTITGGSGVTAPSNGLPGTVDGTKQASTYSWYTGPDTVTDV